MQAASMSSCPGWRKLVFLLMDEMYIKEDLVYNKHMGSLGDINNHLLAFERSLQKNGEEDEVLAKAMMAIMVRGVFTTLRFPYVHFPCEKVTRELLFQPFWEAVCRLERMGLQVWSSCTRVGNTFFHSATFDGASVNRRLAKLHDPQSEVYKVRNIHAPDDRDLFFFSDPPHLIKNYKELLVV